MWPPIVALAFLLVSGSAAPVRAQPPYQGGATAYPQPSSAATAPSGEPLTLADPELREILSRL